MLICCVLIKILSWGLLSWILHSLLLGLKLETLSDTSILQDPCFLSTGTAKIIRHKTPIFSEMPSDIGVPLGVMLCSWRVEVGANLLPYSQQQVVGHFKQRNWIPRRIIYLKAYYASLHVCTFKLQFCVGAVVVGNLGETMARQAVG